MLIFIMSTLKTIKKTINFTLIQSLDKKANIFHKDIKFLKDYKNFQLIDHKIHNAINYLILFENSLLS